MSAEDFRAWLQAMKDRGLAQSDADCARLLKISLTSMVNLKRKGADHRTALACQALLKRLQPFEVAS